MRNDPDETRRLEHRLRTERPKHRAPDEFADRVLSNLSAEDSGVPREKIIFWPRFAVAFGIVAMALLSLHFYPERPATRSGVGSEAGPEDFPAATASVQPLQIELPEVSPERVRLLASRLDQPLEKELENVISDTRQAIQFVASHFLPEN